jgi:hypothetical protein
MRGWISRAAVVMLAMTPAYAQQPESSGNSDPLKARQRISMMEGALERAVSNGAQNMLRQARAVMPDPWMLTGAPEARGFRLDGYGVFFDVEVPALRPPVTWPLRMLYRDSNQRVADELRAMMVDLDPRQREQFSQLVKRLELQSRSVAELQAQAGIGQSQTTAGAAPDAPRAPEPVVDDPEARYTQEVKAALVEAMIEYSSPLSIGSEEWLTVAARDNLPKDPLVPSDTSDFSTVTFRVKGSDLSAYRAGRITLDEVRKKVEVREY